MKTIFLIRRALILAAFGLGGTVAMAQESPEPEPAPAPELKSLADSCAAHKFETTVMVDGTHGKKVKICGEPGQTDAEFLVTLKDSAKKVEADGVMAEGVKTQILTALKAEIARLENAPAPTVAESVATIALPSRPVAVPEAAPQYSIVPPLPAPKRMVAAPGKSTALSPLAGAEAKPPEPIVRPRLTIRCALPRERFAACDGLRRETQLMIFADEDMRPGASLRFLRGGDNRAELDLSTLRKGESLREKLPARVCSGVLRGKVQVQVLSKNQVAETLGPYALYCGS